MLPSTLSSRQLTLDFLPWTFYSHPGLFTLTLDFLPSPSTFYPRPRHLTLDTRLIDKLYHISTRQLFASVVFFDGIRGVIVHLIEVFLIA
jgi:hypothetical protein